MYNQTNLVLPPITNFPTLILAWHVSLWGYSWTFISIGYECLAILCLLGCHGFPFTRGLGKRAALRDVPVNPPSSKLNPSCPQCSSMQDGGRKRQTEIHKVTCLDNLIIESLWSGYCPDIYVGHKYLHTVCPFQKLIHFLVPPPTEFPE